MPPTILNYGQREQEPEGRPRLATSAHKSRWHMEQAARLPLPALAPGEVCRRPVCTGARSQGAPDSPHPKRFHPSSQANAWNRSWSPILPLAGTREKGIKTERRRQLQKRKRKSSRLNF